MLIASNFTGHPCLHLRAGFLDIPSRSAGALSEVGQGAEALQPGAPSFRVPQGISLWGRLFDEGPVLALGLALERRLALADQRPGFAR